MVDDVFERLARYFYRCKGQTFPYNWGVKHPARIHFERMFERLRQEKCETAWMAYIEAQFHFCKDPKTFYPNMLYSKYAWTKFCWYWEKMKRRKGKVNPEEMLSEPHRDGSRIFYAFADSAFSMESYTRAGFTEREAVISFHHNMHPAFCVIAIWSDLENGLTDGIPAVIRHTYAKMKKHRNIREVETLYDRARLKQREAWDRREDILAGIGPQDVPGGPEDLDAVSRALADRP